MTYIMSTALSIILLLLIIGLALYLLYGFVLGCVIIGRFIFTGFVDMLTLKSLRQELHKFRN